MLSTYMGFALGTISSGWDFEGIPRSGWFHPKVFGGLFIILGARAMFL